MAKRVHGHVISVRVTEDLLRAVYEFAKQNNMYNVSGELNISTAARMLIAIGLDKGDHRAIIKASYENARSDILQKISTKFKALMTTISKEIGEGNV